MSATDELRRMLTEAGVEYTTEGVETFYGRHCHAWPINDNDLCVSMAYITPAQAISVTVGRGTCHDVGRYCFTCSECGHTTSEPHHMFNRNDPNVMPNFCPNCGRKVVDG